MDSTSIPPPPPHWPCDTGTRPGALGAGTGNGQALHHSGRTVRSSVLPQQLQLKSDAAATAAVVERQGRVMDAMDARLSLRQAGWS